MSQVFQGNSRFMRSNESLILHELCQHSWCFSDLFTGASVIWREALSRSVLSCKSLFLCLFSEANAQHAIRADRYTLKHQRTSLVEPSLLHDHHVCRHALRRQAVSLSRSTECFDPASVKPLHTGRLRENDQQTSLKPIKPVTSKHLKEQFTQRRQFCQHLLILMLIQICMKLQSPLTSIVFCFHTMEVNGYHQLFGYLHSSKYLHFEFNRNIVNDGRIILP